MRPPARALILGALLLAPLAVAQSSPLRLALDPTSGSVAPGGTTTASLRVTNADPLRPVIVQLSADGDATVAISPREVRVLPGQNATATATISVPANATQ